MRTLSLGCSMPKIYHPSKYARIVESVLSGATCLATAWLLKVGHGLVLRTTASHRAGKPIVPDSLTLLAPSAGP